MVFSETQRQTLEAVLNRIIPPDEYPGAVEAGGIEFITRLIETDEPRLGPIYTQGLNSLDEEARLQFQRPFAQLSATEQDALLHLLETGEVKGIWPYVGPLTFFSTVIARAWEGYLADPANGGNRDARSWEMIGFLPCSPESVVVPTAPDYGAVQKEARR